MFNIPDLNLHNSLPDWNKQLNILREDPFSWQLMINQSLFNNPIRSSIQPSVSSTSDGTDAHSRREMSPKMQNLFSGIGSFFGGIANSGSDQSHTIREGIRSGISMFGPWGAVASAATGVVDLIGDKTGLNLDSINKESASRAGISGAHTFNEIVNSVPGLSPIVGIFGSNTNSSRISDDAVELFSGYSGSARNIMDAQNLGGKRMISTKKANNFINEANRQNDLLASMSRERDKYANNYHGTVLSTLLPLLYEGITPELSFNKKGGTIPEMENARVIIQSFQSKQEQSSDDPQKFQLGGKMNMIVTGALHARKHNLEELNPNLEGEITKKGIPVVTFNEGGEVAQQMAEVEKEELIIHLEATKTIEDYYHEYNESNSKTEKDTIALECGKYLVDELLKNTDDPDKLIKKTV